MKTSPTRIDSVNRIVGRVYVFVQCGWIEDVSYLGSAQRATGLSHRLQNRLHRCRRKTRNAAHVFDERPET
jgi:hypothetical protein